MEKQAIILSIQNSKRARRGVETEKGKRKRVCEKERERENAATTTVN